MHDQPQPLQPPSSLVQQQIRERLTGGFIEGLKPDDKLTNNELIATAGILMQFTDYTQPTIPKLLARQDAAKINGLREAFAATVAASQHPLSYADQFDIAMDLNKNNIPDSLSSLFIASRHYARWLDEPLVHSGITDDKQKIQQMIEWRQAIAACKPAGDSAQDPAGDTYYTWTHALARFTYQILPKHKTIGSRLASLVFHNGTSLMHGLVHAYNPQTVPNDHSIAADYGNAIGQTINDFYASSIRL